MIKPSAATVPRRGCL